MQLRKTRIHYEQTAILAISSCATDRFDHVQKLLADYKRLLFPGELDKPVDSWAEDAKKLLATEVQKVYVIKPTTRVESVKGLKAVEKIGDTGAAAWAASEIAKLSVPTSPLKRVRKIGR